MKTVDVGVGYGVGLRVRMLFWLLLFLLVALSSIAAIGQARQEVPGDYFSLEGALELFKQSQSPEEFERMLNSRDSKVNNLDLNGDGQIDYIRVIDRNQGNVHLFILQAVLSRTESQDVAVISLEKLANGKAVLQITGDADVYGMETIIEPTTEVRVNAGYSTSRVNVDVWTWPVVRYVYSPYYVVWASPWYWDYYPMWWISWRPIVYYDYYSYWYPYRRHYSHCHTHRIVYVETIYRPYRTCSSSYYDRHRTHIESYRTTHRDNRPDRDNRYAGGGRDGRERHDLGNFDRDDMSRSNVDIKGLTKSSKRDDKSYTTDIRETWTKSTERGADKSNSYTRSVESLTKEDKSLPLKRDERSNVSRSESWNKPNISERKSNSSESWNKPNVSERKSNGSSHSLDRPNVSERKQVSTDQPRNFERTTKKSENVMPANRGSQQREFKSVEKVGGKGNSSGGVRSSGKGRGND